MMNPRVTLPCVWLALALAGSGCGAVEPSAGDGEPLSSESDPSELAATPSSSELPKPGRPRPIDRGRVSSALPAAPAPTAERARQEAEQLKAHGYVEEEFVLEGTATTYAASGTRGADGAWKAVPKGQAPYVTRLLVRRPADAKAFNGTALVEWLNVTGNVDAEVGYGYGWEELLRGGYAYVGVSVQAAGVNALKRTQSARYKALNHPGDLYGYDIFAQAGAAIGWPGEVDPLRGLHAERLIAYGQSQSAMRMITYVNAIQPITSVYDGLIVHSRARWGAPIGKESNALLGNGKVVRVRTDINARIMQLWTESEIFQAFAAYKARQPDNDRLRTWEMAGTAHVDEHVLGPDAEGGCSLNAGQQHFMIKAAFRAMHRWVKEGVAPPAGEPFKVNAAKNAIARDQYGNALGGVRTPAVDVPIATLSGEASGANALNPLCMLSGSTTPFTAQQLQTLYPSHDDYVAKVTRSAASAREKGFVLPEDEPTIVAEAKAAKVP